MLEIRTIARKNVSASLNFPRNMPTKRTMFKTANKAISVAFALIFYSPGSCGVKVVCPEAYPTPFVYLCQKIF